MIGADTSVVVCLLVGVPAAQARVARRRVERALEAGEPVGLSDLVTAETYHALHHRCGVPRMAARAIWQTKALRLAHALGDDEVARKMEWREWSSQMPTSPRLRSSTAASGG